MNAQDELGGTPAHIAARNKSLTALAVLTELGCPTDVDSHLLTTSFYFFCRIFGQVFGEVFS